jgi:hypothetical protein
MLVLASFEDLWIAGRVAVVVIYPEKWLSLPTAQAVYLPPVWISPFGDPGEPNEDW